MAISQPNCNCQKAPKGPGPDLEPKWLFHSQIVIARRLQRAQVQIWSQNGHFTAKLQLPEGFKRPRSRIEAKMAISQPNCNCQKASKGPGPGLEPKLPFHSQIVIAKRPEKAQVQVWSQNGHFTAKLSLPEGLKRSRSRFGAKMAISQPNCNCHNPPKGPGPGLEPKWPFHSQIVIARRLQKAQVQIWSQNGHFTAKL